MLFLTIPGSRAICMLKYRKRGDVVDILLRNINPSIVKELDEKAKKIGLSRQQFMKDIIENYTILNNINDREMEYRNHLEKATKMMAVVGEQLEKNTEVINLLMEDEN